MKLLVVNVFLNEEAHLPSYLDSLAAQTRVPDRVLLVDDVHTTGTTLDACARALAAAGAREIAAVTYARTL